MIFTVHGAEEETEGGGGAEAEGESEGEGERKGEAKSASAVSEAERSPAITHEPHGAPREGSESTLAIARGIQQL